MEGFCRKVGARELLTKKKGFHIFRPGVLSWGEGKRQGKGFYHADCPLFMGKAWRGPT